MKLFTADISDGQQLPTSPTAQWPRNLGDAGTNKKVLIIGNHSADTVKITFSV
jgi:hypothetical protein